MPATPHVNDVPPSGEQHEIGHGDQKAVITEVGATLRSYSIGGTHVLDGFAAEEMCSAARGQVLAPWPNRLGDGRYLFEGRRCQAALDEPERRNAIHGLVRWMPWRLEQRVQNVAALSCTIHPQPAYPWRLQLRLEYRLGRDGLTVTAQARNLSPGPIPFALGFHPYLRVGEDGINATRLVLPARRRLIADERGLPTGEAQVTGTEFDFTTGRLIGPTRLDTAFTDFVRGPDDRARVELDHPVSGQGLTLWMDGGFRYVMAYTGDSVEPASRQRASISVEPMTSPPDALRSGTDIVRLEPSTTWSASWGLVPR
jgi:aldose 1-epimerase